MDDLFGTFSSMPTGPFDSPAEERFLHHLAKVLSPDASYDDHVPVDTLCGPFVIDYVVRAGARRAGFEIDGREYHDIERDAWRDAAILEAQAVDVMIHIPAADLYRYPYDALCLISRVEPAFFSDRGRTVLERLSHRAVRRAEIAPGTEHLGAVIWRQEDEAEPEESEEELADEADVEEEGPEDRAERRAEERMWDLIRSDDRRYGPQSPYCLSIMCRRANGSLRPLIGCVRKFGPGSLESVRTAAARPSR